MSDDITAL